MKKNKIRKSLAAVLAVLLLSIFSLGGCTSKINKADIKNMDKFESYTVKATPDNEINTIFQHNDAYNPELAITADEALVFSSGWNYIEAQIADWKNRGYKQVAVMVPMGRDHGSYYVDGDYDGQKHAEIIQKNAGGAKNAHPTPGGDGKPTYYVVPDLGYSRFVADYCKKALKAGADSVYIEEPDGFINYMYADVVKTAWQQEYGEPFSDPANSDEARYKGDRLIAKMFLDAYDEVSSSIKEDYPDTKIYLCTHSTSNYLLHGISAMNYQIVSLPNIDGVVAQAWTDTSLAANFSLNGIGGVHAFEYSYIEYSELLNYCRTNGKECFTLSDPASDNPSLLGKEEELKAVYKENVMAQLINPEINAFELLPWPKRAFKDYSYNYKGLQETVFRLCNDAHLYDAVSYGGSRGIGVVTSYSLISSGHSDSDRHGYTTSALTGLAATLISRGVPVEVLTLEALSPTYLKGIDTLILSYDFIKPDSPSINKAIADFVSAGGTLIYMGGANPTQTAQLWWADTGYATAEAELFNRLKLDVSERKAVRDLGVLKLEQKNNYLDKEINFTDNREIVLTESIIGKKAKSIYSLNEKPVIFEQSVGNGHVIVSGINPAFYGTSKESYKLLEGMVIRALNFKGKSYRAPQALKTVRGKLEVYKTFDRTLTADGTFIDLTNENYEIKSNPVIDKNSYALLYRIDIQTTGVGFCNGKIPNIIENSASKLEFVTSNIINGKAQITITTGGKVPKSIIIEDKFGKAMKESLTAADFFRRDDNGSIYLSYLQSDNYPIGLLTDGTYDVKVTVNW